MSVYFSMSYDSIARLVLGATPLFMSFGMRVTRFAFCISLLALTRMFTILSCTYFLISRRDLILCLSIFVALCPSSSSTSSQVCLTMRLKHSIGTESAFLRGFFLATRSTFVIVFFDRAGIFVETGIVIPFRATH